MDNMNSDNKKGLILVIDDEEDLRDMVEYQFKSKGYDIVTAIDGIDGLEKLENISPDLITLDMNMPRMNGIEFYKKLKGEYEKPKYPVLVLTARANMEQLFRELDVDGFISKPFEIDQLVSDAEDIIARNKRRIVATDGELKRARRICIVDNDNGELDNIALEFLKAGYIINSASSGASAIKRISMDIPDAVIIKQSLVDISGDVVILKLQQNEETKDIKCILFDTKSGSDINVSDAISKKSGVYSFIGGSNPKDILNVVDETFL